MGQSTTITHAFIIGDGVSFKMGQSARLSFRVVHFEEKQTKNRQTGQFEHRADFNTIKAWDDVAQAYRSLQVGAYISTMAGRFKAEEYTSQGATKVDKSLTVRSLQQGEPPAWAQAAYQQFLADDANRPRGGYQQRPAPQQAQGGYAPNAHAPLPAGFPQPAPAQAPQQFAPPAQQQQAYAPAQVTPGLQPPAPPQQQQQAPQGWPHNARQGD